ncbi:MAG: nucleotidyltransferase domain-containing protein [Methanosarcinales archaeon]|nr:nucleotidyltransferase domain-containing protein [Methanosarcinales archaeon]
MDSREDIKRVLEKFKDRVNKDFPVKSIIFFGSTAAGKATAESDIDLIIVSDRFKGMNFIKRAAKMYDYWDLSYPVDFYAIPQKNSGNYRRR